MPNASKRLRGNVLDSLGFDSQHALELKIKAELHQQILKIIKQSGHTPRELEGILGVQQPRVSELLQGKLSTMGVGKLLLYANKLGASATLKLKVRRRAA